MESVKLLKYEYSDDKKYSHTYQVQFEDNSSGLLLFPWRYVGHDMPMRIPIGSTVAVSYLKYKPRQVVDWIGVIRKWNTKWLMTDWIQFGFAQVHAVYSHMEMVNTFIIGMLISKMTTIL